LADQGLPELGHLLHLTLLCLAFCHLSGQSLPFSLLMLPLLALGLGQLVLEGLYVIIIRDGL
jgi:hypothetical protein